MNQYQVGIIDYGISNMFSVVRACEQAGLCPVLTSNQAEINSLDALILPGVGTFGEAMGNLKKLDLVGIIKEYIASDRPFMGICLGMQLLLSESEEYGQHKGLDIVKGVVKRFPLQSKKDEIIKVPHVGWNRIHFDNETSKLPFLRNVNSGDHMYFVHSYFAIPESTQNIATLSTYADVEFCSSVVSGNVFAFQFHPEKSAVKGLRIYENLKEIIIKRKEEKND